MSFWHGSHSERPMIAGAIPATWAAMRAPRTGSEPSVSHPAALYSRIRTADVGRGRGSSLGAGPAHAEPRATSATSRKTIIDHARTTAAPQPARRKRNDPLGAGRSNEGSGGPV